RLRLAEQREVPVERRAVLRDLSPRLLDLHVDRVLGSRSPRRQQDRHRAAPPQHDRPIVRKVGESSEQGKARKRSRAQRLAVAARRSGGGGRRSTSTHSDGSAAPSGSTACQPGGSRGGAQSNRKAASASERLTQPCDISTPKRSCQKVPCSPMSPWK